MGNLGKNSTAPALMVAPDSAARPMKIRCARVGLSANCRCSTERAYTARNTSAPIGATAQKRKLESVTVGTMKSPMPRTMSV